MSTCPCLPRFHTTFGRPSLYENVSKQIENKEIYGDNWRSDSNRIVTQKDRIIFKIDSMDYLKTEITVLDEHGIKVVY
jgi:hypothetical protein